MSFVDTLSQLHRVVRGRTAGKPALRQWVEMAACLAVSGNGPRYYQMAGFWQADRQWREIARHWSSRRYQSELDRLNPLPYRKLSQNKIAEKAILTLMRIPTPRFLGVLDPASGRDADGRELRTPEDLEALFAREGVARACFKLIEGHSGKGFAAADVVRNGTLRFRPMKTDRLLTAAELMSDLTAAGKGARLIEEYLDQDPVYASVNPTSINTLRLWVLRRGDSASTRLGYLRIGRGGSLVDNQSAGGIVAPVDLATGRLSDAIDGRVSRSVYAVHPDHGAAIAGLALPRIAEATALAERTLLAFPHLHFAGVDMAMATDGPRVIELNVQPDREGAAFVGMAAADVFAAP